MTSYRGPPVQQKRFALSALRSVVGWILFPVLTAVGVPPPIAAKISFGYKAVGYAQTAHKHRHKLRGCLLIWLVVTVLSFLLPIFVILVVMAIIVIQAHGH